MHRLPLSDENKQLARCMVAEFVATTLFVFVGCGSVVDVHTDTVTDTVNISFAFGLAISVLVSCVNDISGGHINPAVTYSLMITGNISPKFGLGYITAQMLGGILGAGLLRGAVGVTFKEGLGVTHLAKGINPVHGIVIEAVLTFILVFTVYNVAIRKAAAAHIAPLILGFAVLIAHLASVSITGTGINPARSFGPALIQNQWKDHYVYWIGPIIGATMAPMVYYLLYGTVRPDDVQLRDAEAAYGVRGKHVVRGNGTEEPQQLASDEQ